MRPSVRPSVLSDDDDNGDDDELRSPPAANYGRVNSEFQSSTRGENKRTRRTNGLRKRGAPDRERDKIAFLRKDGGERGHGSEQGGGRESVNRGVTAPSADL